VTPPFSREAYERDGAAAYDEWCRTVKHNADSDQQELVAWAFLTKGEQAGWKVLAEREKLEASRTGGSDG
jgi:hypothetical protein